VRRRDFLQGGAYLPLATLRLPRAAAAETPAGNAGTPFDGSTVRGIARELAGKPYQPQDANLPDPFSKLTYDQYRKIRFDSGHALWRGIGLPFEIQFFHPGFLYTSRVDIYEVSAGQAQPIRYSPDLFDYGELPRPTGEGLGFAGFRVHSPLNRPDHFDELCAFLGASYFRAVARNQGYGISARGLAVKTADAGGEEFPAFKAFWIERPQPRNGSIVVHALLDGPSAAASFRFSIRPGNETVFDVESAIYPRSDIAQVGLAPLTSMFYIGPNQPVRADDYRPSVHDSNGLSIWNGWNEQLWRPLANPTELQVSSFADVNTRGFGLMQRQRDFLAYQDLEARYERRPSLWVETIGGVGEGTVDLVEIPTNREIHDNIVAFWRPTQPLRAKGEYNFNYRLYWCNENPLATGLARVVQTRSGLGSQEKSRLFVIDLAGETLNSLPADAEPHVEVSADHGVISNTVAQPNPEIGGWRISFELAPAGAHTVELRAQLLVNDASVSERWLYRWTS